MCFLDKAFEIWYSNNNGLLAIEKNIKEARKDAVWLSKRLDTINVGGYIHLLIVLDLSVKIIEKNALKNGVPPILVSTRKKSLGRINNIRTDVIRGAFKYWEQWLKKKRRRFKEKFKQFVKTKLS